MIILKKNALYENLVRLLNQRDIYTVFQPIISLEDGTILGHEALSRGPSNTPLQNPEKLFTYAMQFDLLWELEYLCRTKALESASNLNLDGKLFLNVNPNIMNDEKFKEGFTKEFLDKFKMDAETIVFEITEKEAIAKLSDFKRTIDHYKKQSYQIAIDDVGSGYSGLNILTDIHPHFVKLDMKLIRHIDRDKTKQSLVKSLSEFAAHSHINIIAEGIETKEELFTLLHLGIRYGQGYYIQKPNANVSPLRAEIIEFIVEENNRRNQKTFNRITDTTVGKITLPLRTISSTMLICDVNEMMSNDSSIQGFCIVEEEDLVGVITRNQLHYKISGLYGYSLFSNKPIAEIMETNFIQFDVDTPIHLVAKSAMLRSADQLYDFITITKNNKYFGIITVKELLDKTMEIEIDFAKHLNPLTELPGNLMIEQQLKKCINSSERNCVLYLDLDNFKPYNDVYGFEKGDQVLVRVADILRKVVTPLEFIGHIGGDDFIIVSPLNKSVDYCKKIIEEFDISIRQFYYEKDIIEGFISSKNRHGKDEDFPIITLSIAAVPSEQFQTTYELTKRASDLKKLCKQHIGSNYMFYENETIQSGGNIK